MDFLSLNVRGIRDAIKRMSLMQWLSHHRLDIVCPQETHAVSASESSAWFLPFGFLTVSAVGSARARGLAILYRSRLILNQSWVELCGRFSMAEFMNGNFLFRVVCIYAPNTNPECNSFLLSCDDLIDPTISTLLPYSDHVAVVIRVSPPVQLFRGPSGWKLNSSILRDPDFSSIIESFWASWRRRKKDFRSIQLWWDRGKERLKRLALAFCRRLFRRGSVPSSLIWLLIKKPKLIKALSLSRIFMRGYWLVLLILTA